MAEPGEHVACIDCGVPILPSTAERTGGLCMPCEGGYRHDIDAARQRRALMALARERTRHCRLLLETIVETPEDLACLTHDERIYVSVLMLELEVFDGGFARYFWSSSAETYPDALRGLKELGETGAMRYLIDAKQVLFGLGAIPRTQVRRRKIALRQVGGQSMLEEYLGDLDDKFLSHSRSIVDRIEQFGKTHGLLPE